MRSTIAYIFAAVFLCAGHVAARPRTGRLGGTILGVNGRPALRAQVMVERSDGSLPLAARTDSKGRYLFKFIPAGLYDIRASRATAASVWMHNVLVRSGKETNVNLRLKRIKQPKKTALRLSK